MPTLPFMPGCIVWWYNYFDDRLTDFVYIEKLSDVKSKVQSASSRTPVELSTHRLSTWQRGAIAAGIADLVADMRTAQLAGLKLAEEIDELTLRLIEQRQAFRSLGRNYKEAAVRYTLDQGLIGDLPKAPDRF